MPLSSEQVYNDLNGEEVREILLSRFQDLLLQVPEFVRHITLNRVRMTLNVQLDVFGRTPPTFALRDDLIVRTREIPPPMEDYGEEIIEKNHDLTAEINSDTSLGGQPPDQVREEHGIPVMTVQKGPISYEDKPVIRQEGVRYAAFVTQDYGPARFRTGGESPVIASDVISAKNAHTTHPDAKPDFTQVQNPNYKDE